MTRPHTCPVCNGAGTVQRPPWVAGDQPSWAASSTRPYECKACLGTGIIWERETGIDVKLDGLEPPQRQAKSQSGAPTGGNDD